MREILGCLVWTNAPFGTIKQTLAANGIRKSPQSAMACGFNRAVTTPLLTSANRGSAVPLPEDGYPLKLDALLS
jgi:hypothetical protein